MAGGMMEIVIGRRATLTPQEMDALARYRHRVFIQALRWNLPGTHDGLELDQFDHDGTWHVLALQRGAVMGCARLLPTTGPYLLSTLFPELTGEDRPPCSPQVWELSRFAATGGEAPATGPASQWSSPAALDLLRAVLRLASSLGARRLITVSPIGIERLLRRTGIACARAGPPRRIQGSLLYGCWIEVPTTPSQIEQRGKQRGYQRITSSGTGQGVHRASQ